MAGEARKIDELRKHDIAALVRLGAVPTTVLRNMRLYDYYIGLGEVRNRTSLTASQFGLDCRTVERIVKDMGCRP